jgi:hypothetical protein
MGVGRHRFLEKVLLVSFDCDSWACDECADKMRRLHQLRIIEAAAHTLQGHWTFITLTAHENWRGVERSVANLKHGWRKFTERLRRHRGTRHYVLIHEMHADGTLHIHMLYNGRVSKKWVKDNARACGMGYMADAQLLKDASAAGAYVTKYLTKAIAQGDVFPKRFKRVRYSVGFPRFDFTDHSSDYYWTTAKHEEKAAVVAMAIRMGYAVIDKTDVRAYDSGTDLLVKEF